MITMKVASSVVAMASNVAATVSSVAVTASSVAAVMDLSAVVSRGVVSIPALSVATTIRMQNIR